jgi:large conductance mechanosensitive channel
MGILKDFKTFIAQGNAIDLAVGVIIGSAFGKIVSSLVNDILMPPIGFALGGVNFTSLKVIFKNASVDASGKVVEAVSLNYGSFLQSIIDFIIIAFCIFMVVKAINKLKNMKKKEEAAAPAAIPQDIQLLTEIRDLLKK